MPERLLAIRLRALGDVVLTTPALRALSRGHPGASLEVVTDVRYAPLLEGLPGVDRVWALERSTRATLRLVASLRRRRFALAVDFFGNPRSAWITAACGARHTAGYDLRGRRAAYRTRVARTIATADGLPEYAAASHVRLAAAVGGVADGLEARVGFSERSGAAADAALARAGLRRPERTVGLVAAGTWLTKTWPLSHSAVLARRLMAEGHPVAAIGGPGEERVTRRLRDLAPGVAVLTASDTGVLAAVVARLKAVVGTDSGPRHLAAAAGIPTYAWFGPAHPAIWTPRDERHGFWWTALPCRACNRTWCPHWSCLPGLAPERATELVLDHLKRHERPASGLGPAAGA